MAGTCVEGGWVWWWRNVAQWYYENPDAETKTTKELFSLYLKGTKWEDAVW